MRAQFNADQDLLYTKYIYIDISIASTILYVFTEEERETNCVCQFLQKISKAFPK